MAHIHSNEQYDFTVSGLLVHDGKTLLIKHKYLPIWTPPAGHVELDETPIEALFKEIQEEAGITPDHLTLVQPYTGLGDIDRGAATALALPFDMESHPIGEDGHQHINLVYILVCDTNDVRPEVGESQEYEWLTYDDIETFEPIPPALRKQAQYAIRYIKEEYTA